MKKYTFEQDFIERYKLYLLSKEYSGGKEHHKSDYWEHFASLINLEIIGNDIFVQGDSGFYVPEKNRISGLTRNLIFLSKSPVSFFRKIQ